MLGFGVAGSGVGSGVAGGGVFGFCVAADCVPEPDDGCSGFFVAGVCVASPAGVLSAAPSPVSPSGLAEGDTVGDAEADADGVGLALGLGSGLPPQPVNTVTINAAAIAVTRILFFIIYVPPISFFCLYIYIDARFMRKVPKNDKKLFPNKLYTLSCTKGLYRRLAPYSLFFFFG